jgi:hypothetical protein
MPAIYISYRKEDTQGAAAHLYKNLTEAFGRQAVFMDVAGSQPGRDVRDVVDDHLVSCAAMLVIIGKDWVGARDESGQRLLDNPSDPVRIETAAALTQDLPVIPVLVQGAGMLQPADLPPDLADLAFRNPVTLLQSQWGSDVETLVTLLQSLVRGQATGSPTDVAGAAVDPPREPPRPAARVARPQPVGGLPWRTMLAATVAIIVMAAGVYAFMASRPRPVDKANSAPTPAVAIVKAPAPAAAPVSVPSPKPGASATAVPAPAPAPKAGNDRAKTVTDQKPPPPAKAEAVIAAAAPASAVARDAVPREAAPSPVSAGARTLGFQKWTLNSGGCGAGALTVTGTARFSIEKTSDAVVVTEEFRGSGGGFEVLVSGQVEFSQEQASYEIPTSGQWTGPGRSFKSTGLDRVTTSGDGLTPRSANVVKLQSLCG